MSLSEIDTSMLDALARIRAELEMLDTRLQAMQARRDSVAATVYVRVHDDYVRRREVLAQEALPLTARAREAYAQLRVLQRDAEAEQENARLDREEIDFRFSLGEYDADTHRARAADIDARHAETTSACELAESLRQRFLAAVASPDELDRPTTADAATVRMQTLDPHDTRLAPRPPPPPPAESGQVTSSAADSAITHVLRTLKRSDAIATPPRADQTLILRTARLLPQNPEAGAKPVVIALKPLVFGSAPDCDVIIAAAQAHHAEIRASMAGFTVGDRDGGVRVNGMAVQQHLLRAGDALDIAGAQFVFRDA